MTGGASPLGAAICRRLAADGLQVGIHAHAGLARAEALRDELLDAGHEAEACGCDITDPTATAAATARLLADGAVQVVVHNAGAHADVPMAGMSIEDQKRAIKNHRQMQKKAFKQGVIIP